MNLATVRYGGLVTYLDVITAQETLLNNQQLAVQLLVTSVYLVEVPGGIWDTSALKRDLVKPDFTTA